MILDSRLSINTMQQIAFQGANICKELELHEHRNGANVKFEILDISKWYHVILAAAFDVLLSEKVILFCEKINNNNNHHNNKTNNKN